MTKDQFYDDINDFDQLYEFCEDVGCPLNEDWVNDLKRAVDNDFPDAHGRWYYDDIRDKLNDIDEGGEWYRHVGTLEFECIDEEFYSYRDDVAEWCEANYVFNDPDEEEEEPEEDPVPEIPAVPPEDLSGYFDSGATMDLTSEVVQKIQKTEEQKREAARLYREHIEQLQRAHAERVLEEARLKKEADLEEFRECSASYGFAMI